MELYTSTFVEFSLCIILFTIVFSFAACDSNVVTDNSDITNNIDYTDAKSFESALNDGTKVKKGWISDRDCVIIGVQKKIRRRL